MLFLKIREGNNIRLTGKDLKDYIKKRFPDTCLSCLGMPSKQEKSRNNRIEEIQGVRNPYVDDPTLVDSI